MNTQLKTNNSRLKQTITISLTVFILIALFEIQFLANQPWAGLHLLTAPDNNGLIVKAVSHPALLNKLHAGDKITAIKSASLPYVPLSSQTLIDDPDNYPALAAYNEAYRHNSAVHARLSKSGVTIKTAKGSEFGFFLIPVRIPPHRDRRFQRTPRNRSRSIGMRGHDRLEPAVIFGGTRKATASCLEGVTKRPQVARIRGRSDGSAATKLRFVRFDGTTSLISLCESELLRHSRLWRRVRYPRMNFIDCLQYLF